MWTIWDKTSDINGVSAADFLARNKHLQRAGIVYIKTVDGRVTQVESKDVLAKVYAIDPTLPDDEFIAAYEAIIAPPEEETDTTTYAELAQVYAEGVNTIDE